MHIISIYLKCGVCISFSLCVFGVLESGLCLSGLSTLFSVSNEMAHSSPVLFDRKKY